MKNFTKDVLLAVLVATWIAGLIHQLGSWSMTALYVAISLGWCHSASNGETTPRSPSRKPVLGPMDPATTTS